MGNTKFMSAWTEARDRQMIADGWVKRPDGYWEQPKVKLGPNYAEPPAPPKAPKRIRQSSKPLMNKLESEYFAYLTALYPDEKIRPQAKRYQLARGLWYKPDFTVVWQRFGAGETAWECKGPHAFRGGFENLKMAAHEWPEVQFYLVWKQDGEWKQQEILP